MSLTFLGTSGIGGPSRTRAGTAISLNFEIDKSRRPQHWLVDCGEGTRRQTARALRPVIMTERVRKVFVSQVNMERCMGIIPLMSNVMNPRIVGKGRKENALLLEFYGPRGLRNFIRNSLRENNVRLHGRYVVHELHLPASLAHRQTLPMDNNPGEASGGKPELKDRHRNEIFGKDVLCTSGIRRLWLDIIPESPDIQVDAGSSMEQGGDLGFVFTERVAPSGCTSRKIVILGSTKYPHPMQKVTMDATVMVHGLRYAWVPPDVLSSAKERRTTEEEDVEPLSEDVSVTAGAGIGGSPAESEMTDVKSAIVKDEQAFTFPQVKAFVPQIKTVGAIDSSRSGDDGAKKPKLASMASLRSHAALHYHVTPDMVGEFARSVRARRLFLNQFSEKFASSESDVYSDGLEGSRKDPLRSPVMAEIERQASEAFSKRVVAAHDLIVAFVDPIRLNVSPAEKLEDAKSPA
ncbi:hypothetical protein M0805_009139 [Coniferiporia weirii]|nr:hypothetical protein M0805_009139 [Coniferiporia weirii]